MLPRYDTKIYSQIYGDNDRLPSGNMLASMWQSDEYTFPWAARVLEIDRETDGVAMQMDVYDDETTSTGKVVSGWYLYSVERFYTKPLVYNIQCAGDDVTCRAASESASEARGERRERTGRTRGGTVSFYRFDTHDTYARSSKYTGKYLVTADDGTETRGTFDFVRNQCLEGAEKVRGPRRGSRYSGPTR